MGDSVSLGGPGLGGGAAGFAAAAAGFAASEAGFAAGAVPANLTTMQHSAVSALLQTLESIFELYLRERRETHKMKRFLKSRRNSGNPD